MCPNCLEELGIYDDLTTEDCVVCPHCDTELSYIDGAFKLREEGNYYVYMGDEWHYGTLQEINDHHTEDWFEMSCDNCGKTLLCDEAYYYSDEAVMVECPYCGEETNLSRDGV